MLRLFSFIFSFVAVFGLTSLCFIFTRIFVALRISGILLLLLLLLPLGRLNKFHFKRFRHTPYTKRVAEEAGAGAADGEGKREKGGGATAK